MQVSKKVNWTQLCKQSAYRLCSLHDIFHASVGLHRRYMHKLKQYGHEKLYNNEQKTVHSLLRAIMIAKVITGGMCSLLRRRFVSEVMNRIFNRYRKSLYVIEIYGDVQEIGVSLSLTRRNISVATKMSSQNRSDINIYLY